jgi:hypothetical protein
MAGLESGEHFGLEFAVVDVEGGQCFLAVDRGGGGRSR